MGVLGIVLATAVGLGLPARAEAAEGPIVVRGTHYSTFRGNANCDSPELDLNLSDTMFYPKADSVVLPDGGSDYFHLRSYCGQYLGLVTVYVRDVQRGSDPQSPAGRTEFDVRMQLFRLNTNAPATPCGTASWHTNFFDNGRGGATYRNDWRVVTNCGVTWRSGQFVEFSPA
jgi:hypothetical protein